MPGVRLDGRIRCFIRTPRQRGRIRVEGARGVPGGAVTIRGRRIRGILGGEQVAARLDPPFAAAARAAAAAAAQRGREPCEERREHRREELVVDRLRLEQPLERHAVGHRERHQRDLAGRYRRLDAELARRRASSSAAIRSRSPR